MTQAASLSSGGSPKVVLVTGASAGIGRACADRLAGAGWAVIGASRRGTGCDRAASSLWTGLVMNVDDDAAVAAGVDGVSQQHGRPDAVVAAAGDRKSAGSGKSVGLGGRRIIKQKQE